MRVLVALIALAACSFHGTYRPRLTIDKKVDCTNDIGLPIFDTTVALASLGLGAYLYSDAKDDPDPTQNAWSITTPFALAAVLVGVSAVYGYRNVRECDRAQAMYRSERAQARAQRKLRRQSLAVAWTVTKTAMAAARAGDCATVAKHERQVKNLDEEFHAQVFRQDVAIARCLGELTIQSQPQPEPAQAPPPRDESLPPVEVPPPHEVPLPVPPP